MICAAAILLKKIPPGAASIETVMSPGNEEEHNAGE
jgi:hypothetical protein